MGLDLVELVLAIEDEFKLQIVDKDARYLETPGAVANYLSLRLRPNKIIGPCPTQRC